YDLWLRYQALSGEQAQSYRAIASQLVMNADTPTRAAARDELLRGLQGLLGRAPASADAVTADGTLIAGTPDSLPLLREMGLDLRALGSEGYLLRRMRMNGRDATVIAANDDK